MSLLELRGAIAFTVNDTVDDTGKQVVLSPKQETRHVTIQNTGAQPVLISFSEGDFNNGVGWTLAVGSAPLQLELQARLRSIWAKCLTPASSTTIEAIALMQR